MAFIFLWSYEDVSRWRCFRGKGSWPLAIDCCKDKLNNPLKQLFAGEKFVILPMRRVGELGLLPRWNHPMA